MQILKKCCIFATSNNFFKNLFLMAKNETEITIGLGWLDTILKTIKKYGILEIFKALLLLFFISMTLRICIDPGFIFEAWNEWAERNHEKELVERNEKDEKLKDTLSQFLYKYHADRIFVIQYHNGTRDWQHGTMRFEKCLPNTVSMKSDYVNFNLTWLDLPFYLKENNLFIGSMNELKTIDPILYDQLTAKGVDYLACVIIRDEYGDPQGIFGATWPETDIDMNTRIDKIHDYLIEDRLVVMDLIK